MLEKIKAIEVISEWNKLGPMIEGKLPPYIGNAPGRTERLLSAILLGHVVCWKVVENNNVEAIFITNITRDAVGGANGLYISSLYVTPSLKAETWLQAWLQLEEYARQSGCNKIVVYTDDQKMIGTLNSSGCSTSFAVAVKNI